MGSNRFHISVIFNCLLLFGCAFLFFYFLQVRKQPSTAAGFVVLALLLTIRLIYYVNRTNRILGHFLSYMHESDPTLYYSVRYIKSHFKGLNESMEKLIGELKEHRINLEVQAHYLETILDNVSTGILCFDHAGKIQIINRAAGKCLKMERLTHLEELDNYQHGLGTRLLRMRPNAETTETVLHEGKPIQLAIHISQIKLKKETVHIAALNDISNQMEEQEILSWKRLLRVINHEIMNSMTPIITLSMAIRRKLANGEDAKPSEQLSKVAIEDAIQSALIIEERSAGLVKFIERYKKLTSLPPLKMERFLAGELFAKLEHLYKEEFHAKGILLNWPSPCNTELEADRQMLEQVLINLVKNSMEAFVTSKDPEIELSCHRDADDHICLVVRDNGEGIHRDKLDQVFVPFFTTREEGSGIGLSLCKQIIRSHGGTIHIESAPGEGTRVIITL
jgi:nitrogen fixation/metabolism regulation signal transduction histidine kinase